MNADLFSLGRPQFCCFYLSLMLWFHGGARFNFLPAKTDATSRLKCATRTERKISWTLNMKDEQQQFHCSARLCSRLNPRLTLPTCRLELGTRRLPSISWHWGGAHAGFRRHWSCDCVSHHSLVFWEGWEKETTKQDDLSRCCYCCSPTSCMSRATSHSVLIRMNVNFIGTAWLTHTHTARWTDLQGPTMRDTATWQTQRLWGFLSCCCGG